MVNPGLLKEATHLAPADRLELIGALWDSLSPDDLPVTDAERAMIDDRLVDLADHPADARPWSEVEADLRSRR